MATANSYATVDTANAYHTTRGNMAWLTTDGDPTSALIRATQYIEGKYRGRWPGLPIKYRLGGLSDSQQALSWPRYGAVDNNGFAILPNTVPIEVVYATCEAALRELLSPGSLQPDITLTGIKREWAGDTGFEYFQGVAVPPHVTVIDGILAPILLTSSKLFGCTERF
ncbi:DnaT-like ssDNA-binding protein [Bradyrhizobium lablabi]|uniref:DnaT-like ssDNA-binding protein n=1 Tax=Bradyrhizobium lablabi TaxID=722472 RepID=UPI001BA5FBA5|nr:DnaT-like ssDNA-binding protein [Bradyrhizobium lablabi]MBR0693665.1 hypothetical protein [Bradyrhizobium lablabi]